MDQILITGNKAHPDLPQKGYGVDTNIFWHTDDTDWTDDNGFFILLRRINLCLSNFVYSFL